MDGPPGQPAVVAFTFHFTGDLRQHILRSVWLRWKSDSFHMQNETRGTNMRKGRKTPRNEMKDEEGAALSTKQGELL